ncbi:hypothetical protein D934_06935 [Xylella fastidiosa subsp. sandyi Ann-1]|uniref:Uncharacterized protein n=1 Tax=Xylella fastidiosa subsp. sandyi Ann-1 TaxID=155920 RepID=A0A060H6M1_XYLFS|nr:hypothetical protein D934_06935 [Xylella fastidiosa subsp. sandyi Ann-1]
MRAQSVSFLYPLSKHPAVLEGGKSRLLKRFGSLNYWLYVLMKMSKANNVGLVCAWFVLGLCLWCRRVCGVWR